MTLNYTYRPDKLRHSTTVRTSANPAITTLHHWDGQNMILETENGRIKGKYVRGANLIAQVIDLSLFYYLLNAHGDVIQRVGANGEAPQYKYDAFGNQREEVETAPNPFRYCGEYWDRHAEEIYLRARTYNPANGRFTTSDPARAGSNWYNYCSNNPVTRVDPTGLDSYVWVDESMFSFSVQSTVDETVAALEQIYGPVVHVCYSSNPTTEEFQAWWGGLPDEQIDGVVVISHGYSEGLTYWDEESEKYETFLELDDINALPPKNIDMMILYGCNAGNINNSENNVAYSFSKKVGENGVVIGPDGRRMYIPFTSYSYIEENTGERKSLGYMAYYPDGNHYTIFGDNPFHLRNAGRLVLELHEAARLSHPGGAAAGLGTSLYDTIKNFPDFGIDPSGYGKYIRGTERKKAS